MSAFPLLRYAGGSGRSASERRLEPRFPAGQTIRVTILPDSGDAFSARTLDVSPSGLSFASPRLVPVSTLIKVEAADVVVLAEVRHCRRLCDDPLEYAAGASIEHVFFGWKQFWNTVRAARWGVAS